MRVSDFIEQGAATAKSLIKMALHSRPTTIRRSRHEGPLIIMANGPSLNDTIASSASTLRSHDTMSVNFAPLTEVFTILKPKYHIMADPVFFGQGSHHNIGALYGALAAVDWSLTLLVPAAYRNSLPQSITTNPNITVSTFNFVGAEGYGWLEKMAYRRGWAMPRPRNVLIPAIMTSLNLGYDEVYITGADHSWMQSISVDEDNNVISVQPHFYKDDDREQKRVDTTYRGYRLHDIVHSFYVAFRSYHRIRRYADATGARIYNATPGSFIDAFPRRTLPAAK